MAAKEGGGDPESNPRLRLALERARQLGVPNDNIERAIKRGTGELQAAEYVELTYEGYGPGGVALMINVVTDNRNRTASDLRYIFSRNGGNLGESGSVAWMFERKGLIVVDRGSVDVDEDELLLAALEAGAEDFQADEETYQVITPPQQLEAVRDALEAAGCTSFSVAEVTQLPQSQVRVEGKEAEQLLKLLDALDDHDDVQQIYGNYDVPAEVMAAFDA